jgi:hypothetical protein
MPIFPFPPYEVIEVIDIGDLIIGGEIHILDPVLLDWSCAEEVLCADFGSDFVTTDECMPQVNSLLDAGPAGEQVSADGQASLIPEPASFLLMAAGAVALLSNRRRTDQRMGLGSPVTQAKRRLPTRPE